MNEAIEYAARQLAAAEQSLLDANRLHQEAMARVATIEERLRAVAERHEKIRADLAAGVLGDREGGSLLASADEDQADLRRLADEARARAAAAAPEKERRAVGVARAAIERVGREIAFAALHARVTQLETAFMQALGALYQQGVALGRGRSLSGIFQPSSELRMVLVHNAPPPAPPAPAATENEDGE